MQDKVKNAFDTVRADPALKSKALDVVLRHSPRRSVPARRWVPAMACLLVVVLALGGCGVYFTPTSVISVDVNPSVELSVNRFHRVISANGCNADGETLLDGLSLRFLDYREALRTILAADAVTHSLSEGEVLSISVADADEARQTAMLSEIAQTTVDEENAYCFPSQLQDVEEAHHLGLSCGRYRVFSQIQALEPSFDPQDAAQMTMAQLRDLLAQLTEEHPDQLPDDDLFAHHGENGQNGHHGYGGPASTAQPSPSPDATSQATQTQPGHHGQGSPSAAPSPSPDGPQQSAQNQYRHHGSNGHHGG